VVGSGSWFEAQTMNVSSMNQAWSSGKSLLAAEMTIRKGEVVWDLNGRAAQDWKDFPYRRRSPQ
jgi:hypothetical protein